MSRMAAAYSLQKMRKALSELQNNVATQKEAQRMQKEAHNNFTSNFRENSNTNPSSNGGTDSKTNEKRNNINNNLEESECEYIQKRVRNHGKNYKNYVQSIPDSPKFASQHLLNFLIKTCTFFIN